MDLLDCLHLVRQRPLAGLLDSIWEKQDRIDLDQDPFEVEFVPFLSSELLCYADFLPGTAGPQTPDGRGHAAANVLSLQRPFPSLIVDSFVLSKLQGLDGSYSREIEREGKIESCRGIGGRQVPVGVDTNVRLSAYK